MAKEYIKREDARLAVMRAGSIGNILPQIEALPAADVVEVKHGRWITHRDKLTSCSECHTLGSPQWKGCPVCLARMDGE